MAILFSITFFAFCALLWAALSVLRHLRRSPGIDERNRAASRANHFLRESR